LVVPLPLYGAPLVIIAAAMQADMASFELFQTLVWFFQNPSVHPKNGLRHPKVTSQESLQPQTFVTISLMRTESLLPAV
jgi:hypothetical protein